MDGTIKQETTFAVDTAILLTSSGVFSHGAPGSQEAIPSPLTRVGGMTLFQRAVVTLQRGGISQIWVLAGPEESRLRGLIKEDARIQAAVRWLPVAEFPPHDPETWETLAAEMPGACMVVGCHTVFSVPLVHRLRQEGAEGKAVVVVGTAKDGLHHGNPRVLLRREDPKGRTTGSVMFQDIQLSPPPPSSSPPDGQSPHLPIVADMMVLPVRLLGISGVLQANGTNPLRLALEQAAVEGTVETISGMANGFSDVRGHNGPERAEHMLVQSLKTVKGGMDGLVDRYVNRKCSGFFTKIFLKLGWTPNTITLLSMCIGLLAGGFLLPGIWEWALLGALLFQLSVIIDCCDGEVARLTYAESKFGQELDIWADNVVHIGIFAGMAGGAYLHGPWEQSTFPLLLGASAILANVVSLLLVNHARHLRTRPRNLQHLGDQDREKIDKMLGNVVNRDFSILVLICAWFGILHWFLALAAIGSWFFVMSMTWILRRSLLSRA